MTPAPLPPDESSFSGRFAAHLRALREKTKMTGSEAAQAVSDAGYPVPMRTYYNWEAGRAEPPLNAFPAIAKAMKAKKVRDLLPPE